MDNNKPTSVNYAIKGVATASVVLGICALAFGIAFAAACALCPLF